MFLEPPNDNIMDSVVVISSARIVGCSWTASNTDF